MTPFEVFVTYTSLRNHFNVEKYDFFKYNGKTRVNTKSFDNRKDKFFFEKLAKHIDPHNFMLSNFAANSKAWVRDIAYSEKAEEIYNEWTKKNQSLTYHIKNDLSKLHENFDSNFVVNDTHPYILRLFLADKISLESVCVLTDAVGCYNYWAKKMDDPIWADLSLKIRKYIPFIKYDKEKIRKLVVDYYSNQ